VRYPYSRILGFVPDSAPCCLWKCGSSYSYEINVNALLHCSDIGRRFTDFKFCTTYKYLYTGTSTYSKLILTNIVTQEKECNLIAKEMQIDCWECFLGLNLKEIEQLLNSYLVHRSYLMNSDIGLHISEDFPVVTRTLKSSHMRGCCLCADASMLFLFPILATSPGVKNFAKHITRQRSFSTRRTRCFSANFLFRLSSFLNTAVSRNVLTNTRAHTYKRLAVLQLQVQTHIYK
jgi:hypothetical protein